MPARGSISCLASSGKSATSKRNVARSMALDWAPPSDANWQVVVFKQFVVDSPVMAGVGEAGQIGKSAFSNVSIFPLQ